MIAYDNAIAIVTWRLSKVSSTVEQFFGSIILDCNHSLEFGAGVKYFANALLSMSKESWTIKTVHEGIGIEWVSYSS